MVYLFWIQIFLIFYFYFSRYDSNPNEGYVLILLFLIFFSLLSIVLFNLLIHTDKIIYNAIYSLVIDSIVIVLFHFLWFNDETRLIYSFIEAGIISAYLPLCQIFTKIYHYERNLAYSLIIFNYGPFITFNCIPYAIGCAYICKEKKEVDDDDD